MEIGDEKYQKSVYLLQSLKQKNEKLKQEYEDLQKNVSKIEEYQKFEKQNSSKNSLEKEMSSLSSKQKEQHEKIEHLELQLSLKTKALQEVTKQLSFEKKTNENLLTVINKAKSDVIKMTKVARKIQPDQEALDSLEKYQQQFKTLQTRISEKKQKTKLLYQNLKVILTLYVSLFKTLKMKFKISRL